MRKCSVECTSPKIQALVFGRSLRMGRFPEAHGRRARLASAAARRHPNRRGAIRPALRAVGGNTTSRASPPASTACGQPPAACARPVRVACGAARRSGELDLMKLDYWLSADPRITTAAAVLYMCGGRGSSSLPLQQAHDALAAGRCLRIGLDVGEGSAAPRVRARGNAGGVAERCAARGGAAVVAAATVHATVVLPRPPPLPNPRAPHTTCHHGQLFHVH